MNWSAFFAVIMSFAAIFAVDILVWGVAHLVKQLRPYAKEAGLIAAGVMLMAILIGVTAS